MNNSDRESDAGISYLLPGDESDVERICRRSDLMVEASRKLIERIYTSLNAENGKAAPVERRKGTERLDKPGASLKKSPLHPSTYIEEEYDLPSTQIARAPYSDPNIQFSLGLCE